LAIHITSPSPNFPIFSEDCRVVGPTGNLDHWGGGREGNLWSEEVTGGVRRKRRREEVRRGGRPAGYLDHWGGEGVRRVGGREGRL
jgi:hypothetical protein